MIQPFMVTTCYCWVVFWGVQDVFSYRMCHGICCGKASDSCRVDVWFVGVSLFLFIDTFPVEGGRTFKGGGGVPATPTPLLASPRPLDHLLSS